MSWLATTLGCKGRHRMKPARVLLLDAAPGELLDRELARLLGHKLAVTLNLRRVADKTGARSAWGGRVDFTDRCLR